jgi:diadenosine tetraphosphatase ApaH/serine/threonine PP2A family protein phosphatase
MRKYGNANPWKYCVEVFDYLNLAAVRDRGTRRTVNTFTYYRSSTGAYFVYTEAFHQKYERWTRCRSRHLPPRRVSHIHLLQVIERVQEIPHEGSYCDLMWSDPDDVVNEWALSPRGAGYLFGRKVTNEVSIHLHWLHRE